MPQQDRILAYVAVAAKQDAPPGFVNELHGALRKGKFRIFVAKDIRSFLNEQIRYKRLEVLSQVHGGHGPYGGQQLAFTKDGKAEAGAGREADVHVVTRLKMGDKFPVNVKRRCRSRGIFRGSGRKRDAAAQDGKPVSARAGTGVGDLQTWRMAHQSSISHRITPAGEGMAKPRRALE